MEVHLFKLNNDDVEPIKAAQAAISKNYDEVNFYHTVGAAVRCNSGKIYVVVNIYSIHGACSEQIAIGNAVTNGERNFTSIVADRGQTGEEIFPPCGNCRQILSDYAPNCEVIISFERKVLAKDLIPFAYRVEV